MRGFDHVFAALPEAHALAHGVMDKGYDSNAIRVKLQAHQITPVIPPKKNRKEPIAYGEALYKLREQVERFFNRLKQFRRIATRYDKRGRTYVAFIHIVAAVLVIK
jgi:transposase